MVARDVAIHPGLFIRGIISNNDLSTLNASAKAWEEHEEEVRAAITITKEAQKRKEREPLTDTLHNQRRRLPDTLWIAPTRPPNNLQHNFHQTYLRNNSTSVHTSFTRLDVT